MFAKIKSLFTRKASAPQQPRFVKTSTTPGFGADRPATADQMFARRPSHGFTPNFA